MTTNPVETLYGRNPIMETLRAGRRRVSALRVAQGAQVEGALAQVIELARKQDLPVNFVPRQELDRTGINHQGVAADASLYPYADLDGILKLCDQSPERALILILDMLQDPQNLGTLLRSAEAVGVAGVIIPAHRSASVTPAVVRASAGATEHLLIARQNLAQAMRMLKQAQFWIAGLEQGPQAKDYSQASYTGRMALVVGNEGAGLRRLVRESCDFLVEIPMRGQIGSLNAAVAGSIVLYAARAQRI
jgi:23S rRNA (guanosine2251-2'-O)-methyltransferase